MRLSSIASHYRTGKPTDISPDITITLNNAGHIMGSATVHLNISGVHNILYSGDYNTQEPNFWTVHYRFIQG